VSIAAVLLDMDGVLLDSFEAWCAVMNATAVHFGLPSISRDAFGQAFGQSTEADVDRFYPGQTVESVEAQYAECFGEHAAAVTAMPDAAWLLEALDGRGIPTAVVTNTHSVIARAMLEAVGVIPHALVGSSDVPMPKPAPDMLFRACQVLGTEPWDVLMVGDSLFDKQAAAAAGCSFAGLGVAGNFTIRGLREVLGIVDGTA